MQITVLGNSGPYPGPGKACSGYYLEADGLKILLDCGCGILAELQKKCSLTDLDAVFLSHLHADHMSDMLVMRYALMFEEREYALPVYMPGEPESEAWLLSGCKYFNTVNINPKKYYTIGNLKIYFMAVKHPVLAYAVRVEKKEKAIVYSGDTMYDENLIDFATNADLFICDAAFGEKEHWPEAPHASAKQAAHMAKEAKAKRLMLTHFSPKADQAALLSEAKEVFPHSVISKKGLTVKI